MVFRGLGGWGQAQESFTHLRFERNDNDDKCKSESFLSECVTGSFYHRDVLVPGNVGVLLILHHVFHWRGGGGEGSILFFVFCFL